MLGHLPRPIILRPPHPRLGSCHESAPLVVVATVSAVSALPVVEGAGNWSPPAARMRGVGKAEPPAGVAAAWARPVLPVLVGGDGWPHPRPQLIH